MQVFENEPVETDQIDSYKISQNPVGGIQISASHQDTDE
jgi:hypothetical protein